jgi:biopolymer transport protein ExbD
MMAVDEHDAGSLRLPVPFFDLFLVLLICFMLFLSPLPQPGIEASDVQLPLARTSERVEPGKVLATLATKARETWQFEPLGSGRRMGAAELAAEARASGRRIVLVLPATTTLQAYVELQAGLGAQGVEYGIAVRNGEAK